MIDFEKEKTLPPAELYRLYAGRLQCWRLCCKAACHRARSCRGDRRRCTVRITEWAEAVKEAGQREFNARDPQRQADIEDLKKKMEALRQRMAENA